MTTRYPATTVPAPFRSTAATARVFIPGGERTAGARAWAIDRPTRRNSPLIGA